jgi:aspartate/methionine/tyrosine aminotransferase
MDEFSSRVVAARRSAIREIFDAANRLDGVIRLEIGEPSFNTPDFIVDAAVEAARSGFTRYTPNGGYASLRELLVEKIGRVDGYDVSADEVVVTPGGMNALYSIYLALLNPGDEVLLPTPGFPNMDEMVRLLGGVPVFYPLLPEDGYLPDLELVEGLIGPRTKALFMNSPGNPTGAVFGAELVEGLLALTQRHGVWLVSDEVYDELILDDDLAHFSPARLDRSRVVTVYSFSKVYAMTGWRVGYCAAPPELAELLRKLQEPLVSCPSAISQKAAEAALTGPRAEIDAMREAYRGRRDSAWEAFRAEDLDAVRTQGTFYMLVDVSAAGLESMELARRLLEEERVAVAPGLVFGPGGEGKARISFAGEPETIREGVRRIARLLERAATEPARA